MSVCQICCGSIEKYTIQCGSKIPHKMCFDCERQWRLKSTPTFQGRLMSCPFCRTVEKEPGLRSRSSYEAELKLLYETHYPREKKWCKNRSILCETSTKTSRKCNYPAGCSEFVCRSCNMCFDHFSQLPIE